MKFSIWKIKLLHYRDIHIGIRYSILQIFSISKMIFILISYSKYRLIQDYNDFNSCFSRQEVSEGYIEEDMYIRNEVNLKCVMTLLNLPQEFLDQNYFRLQDHIAINQPRV